MEDTYNVLTPTFKWCLGTGLQIEAFVAFGVHPSNAVAQRVTAILFAVQTQAFSKSRIISTPVGCHLLIRVQNGVREEVDRSLVSTFYGPW